MTRTVFALFAALCFMASSAEAAGLKFIQIPADESGPAMDAAIWSPCSSAPAEIKIRAVVLPAVADCPVEGEGLPLIVVSHGYAGWYLGHHDTAEALADAGFVVVAINHPHANYADMSGGDGLGVLIERPKDIRRTIDFMLAASPYAARIDPQRIGFYGFSQGGYTGLVLAGGNPAFDKLPPRCAGVKTPDCPPRPAGFRRPPMPSLVHDPRIKAMVLADPLSVVFQTPESVGDIRIPLQVWGSELGGGAGASPADIAALKHALPGRPDFRTVPNAVHFSFMAPCPDVLRTSEACIDAPGFDRVEFHRTFNREVVAFFRKHLAEARRR